MIALWQGPSGRLHRNLTCSGSDRNKVTAVRRSADQLQAIWDAAMAAKRDPSIEICRCAWPQVPRRAPAAPADDEKESAK